MVLETGLQGSHVLVTGGTRGMGKAMVESFLREGANVSYCARTVTGVEFAEFPAAGGAVAVGTAVDISSRDLLIDWIEKSTKKFGRLDTVISNASPMHTGAEAKFWVDSFNVDIMAMVTLIQTATPYLEKSPNASILVQSSFVGREYYMAEPGPYGAFKAAQLQHVQELSHLLGPRGIRVNAISPGPILFKNGVWDEYTKSKPEWVEQQRMKVALRRLGNPQEIANAAIFLSSKLSSYIAGANLLVDGGIHIGTQF